MISDRNFDLVHSNLIFTYANLYVLDAHWYSGLYEYTFAGVKIKFEGARSKLLSEILNCVTLFMHRRVLRMSWPAGSSPHPLLDCLVQNLRCFLRTYTMHRSTILWRAMALSPVDFQKVPDTYFPSDHHRSIYFCEYSERIYHGFRTRTGDKPMTLDSMWIVITTWMSTCEWIQGNQSIRDDPS